MDDHPMSSYAIQHVDPDVREAFLELVDAIDHCEPARVLARSEEIVRGVEDGEARLYGFRLLGYGLCIGFDVCIKAVVVGFDLNTKVQVSVTKKVRTVRRSVVTKAYRGETVVDLLACAGTEDGTITAKIDTDEMDFRRCATPEKKEEEEEDVAEEFETDYERVRQTINCETSFLEVEPKEED